MAKELYIDGELVDLKADLKLPVNFQNVDIEDLSGTSTRSNHSFSFNVPATNNNKIIFSFPEEITENSFDGTIEKPARIEQGGTPYLDGIARISKVTKDGVFTEYSIIVIDGNGTWVSDLKGRNLQDLDFSDFDHTYNKANVDQSETLTESSVFLYPLVNYGKPLGGSNNWIVEDRTPWYRTLKVFTQIFTDIGWQISSEFINGTFFRRLFDSPETNPKISESTIDNNKFRVGLSSSVNPLARQLTNGFFRRCPFDQSVDSGGQQFFNSVDNDFTTGATPQHNVDLVARQSYTWDWSFSKVNSGALAQLPTAQSEVKLALFLNGNLKYSKIITVPKISLGQINITISGTWITTSLDLKPGDTVFVSATPVTPNQSISGKSVQVSFAAGLSNVFRNNVFDTIIKGATIEINALLPDQTQLDFIKDIKEQFNLVFYADNINRTIQIEPFDQFYDQVAVDWSDRWDISKPIIISHLGESLNKKIRFGYKVDDNDKHIIRKQDEFNNGDQFGSLQVDIENVNAKDGILDKSLKHISPTWVGAGIIGAPSGKIPILWDTDTGIMPNSRTSEFATRRMFYNGKVNLDPGESWFFQGKQRSDYPQLIMQDEASNNVNSLYFDDGVFTNGLDQKHWRNRIETINKSRKYVTYLNLSDSDIQSLDFRVPLYLEDRGSGAYYILQAINGYDSDSVETVKVELIRIINPVPIASVTEFKAGINTQIDENTQPVEDNVMQTKIPVVVDLGNGPVTLSVGQDMYMKRVIISGGQITTDGTSEKVRYNDS